MIAKDSTDVDVDIVPREKLEAVSLLFILLSRSPVASHLHPPEYRDLLTKKGGTNFLRSFGTSSPSEIGEISHDEVRRAKITGDEADGRDTRSRSGSHGLSRLRVVLSTVKPSSGFWLMDDDALSGLESTCKGTQLPFFVGLTAISRGGERFVSGCCSV